MNTMKTKQTAANNTLLANAKRLMNAPIYKETSRLMNTEGEAAAITYLRKFFRAERADAMIAALMRADFEP